MSRPGEVAAQATDVRSHRVSGSDIQGVELRPVPMHKDIRGCFTEVFQESWGTVIDPCQWSVVDSQTNVFRGCHLHLRHDEYFCLLTGESSLGLRDARPQSPTFGNWQLYRLFGEDRAVLTFPAGLVHGWYFHQPSLHLQAVSESYVDYHKDDNFGVHWADPALEIPWPISEPVLAERAASFGTLEELMAAIAAAGHR